MQMTIPFPALDPVKDNWVFLKMWIDLMQSPSYVLLSRGDWQVMKFISFRNDQLSTEC
jgi:hypothetical protein